MNEQKSDNSVSLPDPHMRVNLSEERLRNYLEVVRELGVAFDLLDDHVVITDPDGNIIYMNEAAERNTGFFREEAFGKNPADLWGGNMSQEFYERMWQRIKVEKLPFVGEARNRKKDGTEYWQELHISPVLWENGDIKFFIGVEPNITKKKEKEKFREEFSSMLGHQLKSPLTSYKWALEWLSKEGNLTGDQKEMIHALYEQNESLVNLVGDLLTYARIGSVSELKKSYIDLVKEIETIIERARAKHSQVAFSFSKGDGPLLCTSYASLVSQVFTNIIFNAAEYSDAEMGTVDLFLGREDNTIFFSCKDNGIGIPPEDQERIFLKFFRASNALKTKGKGTGLGLFIVKMITDNLGWDVSFESPLEHSRGTVFYVRIPMLS